MPGYGGTYGDGEPADSGSGSFVAASATTAAAPTAASAPSLRTSERGSAAASVARPTNAAAIAPRDPEATIDDNSTSTSTAVATRTSPAAAMARADASGTPSASTIVAVFGPPPSPW